MPPDAPAQFEHAVRYAQTFTDLLRAAHAQVHAATGYRYVWLMIGTVDHPDELRFVGVDADCGPPGLPARVRVSGNAVLEVVARQHRTVVVSDAQVDTRASATLRALDARTVVQLPLLLTTVPFGVFGAGTFGDEGPREPSVADLAQLVAIAAALSAAASRLMLGQLAPRPVVDSTTRPWWIVWRPITSADPGIPARPWWRPTGSTLRTIALMAVAAGAATWELFDNAQRSTVLMLVATTGLPLLFRLEEHREDTKGKR